MQKPLAIGIDLGGTQLRAALVDCNGGIVSRAAVATDVAGGPLRIIEQIKRLCEEIDVVGRRAEIAGAGVSSPGPLDSETGMVIAISTLPGWDDFPLRRILEETLALPVVLENDGIAAANGEWKFGAARGLQHFVYVTVSTGIGGGVAVDNRLLHGRRGMAGHVGHMVIDPGGPRCSCGALGCFEALASGTALGRAGKAVAAARPESLLARQPDTITARDVVAAAREGDAAALEVMAREATWLGIGFCNLIHLYSPQRLIMGGGVAQGFDLLQEGIAAVMRSSAMAPFRDVEIVPASLGDNAGLVGAAASIWENEPKAG